MDSELSQIDEKMYANFHNPSWETTNRHLPLAEIPKGLVRHLEIISENDKKGEFKHERMFGRVAKIPSAITLIGMVKMDFVDYGDYAAFLHIRDTFSRFPALVFIGTKKRVGEQPKWSE